MHRDGEEVHIDSEEASGGANDGRAHVRWILAISLLLAIGALSFIWITGALISDDDDASPQRVQGAAAETG